MRNTSDHDEESTTSASHDNGCIQSIDAEECSDDEDNSELVFDNWSLDFDMDVNPAEEQLLISSVLKKCRAISKVMKQSLILSDYFRKEKELAKCDKNIRTDCKSRWSSTHILISSFIILKNLIIQLFSNKKSLKLRHDQTQKLSSLELTIEDWELLSSLNEILEPFAVATELISGKNYPTIGLCYFAVNKIKCFCMNNDNHDEQIKKMKKLLLEKIKKYFYDDHEQMQHLQVGKPL